MHRKSPLGFVFATAIATLLASLAQAQTEPGKFSLRPLPKDAWDVSAAAHLLARAGFSGTPSDVQKLSTMSLDEAVNALVDFEQQTWQNAPPPIPQEMYEGRDRTEMRELTPEERRELNDKRQKQARESMEEVRLWWIERMIATPRPFEEKMTLLWHGHFTSGAREVKSPVFMKEQNDFLRKNCVGNFRDLVLGISKDRAMLSYLDGRNNVKEKPNENFARELMELFTMGVGNYSETDVKEAARAFTGWSFDENGYVFRARQHDGGEKRFLKQRGKFNGDDIVDIIMQQPATAKFLATKLAKFYMRPEPERELIDAIASELRKNKYEMRPTMKTIFKSQAFYHSTSRGVLVKSPAELLVSTARKFNTPIENLRAAERAMASMGQALLQPPNVKGWAGGTKWINTATLFNRYNIVSLMVQGGGADRRPAAKDDMNDEEMRAMMAAGGSMEAKSRMEGDRRQPAYDPTPALRDNKLTTAEHVVDYYSTALLAAPLDSEKRTALVEYLDGGKKFDAKAKTAAERVRMMICLMVSTPEFQLY